MTKRKSTLLKFLKIQGDLLLILHKEIDAALLAEDFSQLESLLRDLMRVEFRLGFIRRELEK